jgi:hypothetical protein
MTKAVTWHVVTHDNVTLSVKRPDRGDAAPVNVWVAHDLLVGIRTRHVAVGGDVWSASPCGCAVVQPEAVPTFRRHLRAVA